jgi:uncharacterized protein YutE (UPF0331/DUF86 family)
VKTIDIQQLGQVIKENLMLQNAVEHALQVAIEAVIDTAERVLVIEKKHRFGNHLCYNKK